MIKLKDILKEVQSDSDKLDQAKELLATLAELEEGALSEASVADIAKKLKKLGLTLSMLGALAATPNLTAAQQKAIDIAKQDITATAKVNRSEDVMKVQTALQNVRDVMIQHWKNGTMGIELGGQKVYPKSSEDIKQVDQRFMPIVKHVSVDSSGRVGSAVDGIIGEYTSKYKFPIDRRDTLHLTTSVNGKEVSHTKTTKTSISGTMLDAAMKAGLSLQQMKEWNAFVDWMGSNGYAGKEDMNKTAYSKSVLNKYKKEVNPNFWVQWK